MKYFKEKINLSGQNRPSIVFFCEGKTEVHFVDKYLELLEVSRNECYVLCFEGISNIKSKLNILSKQSNFESVEKLGLFFDAETAPEKYYNDAVSGLINIGFARSEHGDVLFNIRGKESAIFMSPDNSSEGAIENLIIKEIENQAVYNCLTAYINCGNTMGINIDNKGLVQIFISSLNGRLCGSGRAFEAGVLSVEHDAYQNVRDFVANLVNAN